MSTDCEDDWAKGLTADERRIVMEVGSKASVGAMHALVAAGVPPHRLAELALRIASTTCGATIFAGAAVGRDRLADAETLAAHIRSMVARMPGMDAKRAGIWPRQ